MFETSQTMCIVASIDCVTMSYDFVERKEHVSDMAAAATAKPLQSCPTLCNPRDGSPPGSPSLGFSRQEHWSGLPFPSPMHESEKGKWSCSVTSHSLQPHGLQPTRLLHPWDFPGKGTGVGCHCLLQSDMATSIQTEKLEWKLMSFLIPSYIYYHIAFSNIFSSLAEQLSC